MDERDAIHRRVFKRMHSDVRGQASVEYLLVGLVLMIIVSALAYLGQVVTAGLFMEHASAGASHTIRSTTAGVIGDVFLF